MPPVETCATRPGYKPILLGVTMEQKSIGSFKALIDLYCDLFAERYFWHAAIKLGYCRTAGMSTEEKQNILKEYHRKLEKGEVKDVSAGVQECTFKHLSHTWQVDPRTMQDLKEFLKEEGEYYLKEEMQEDKNEDKKEA